MNMLNLYTRASTKDDYIILDEYFSELFDRRLFPQKLLQQMKNEINYYLKSDALRVKSQANRKKMKYPDKRQNKREIGYLRRLILNDGSITDNEKHLNIAKEVARKHFGKYKVESFNVENLADILNAINLIKKKKTLMFDSTTEFHAYKKGDKSKISLKSQIQDLFIQYGYYDKVTTYYLPKNNFFPKYSLQVFNLTRVPPPKTMYRYEVTKEINKKIDIFLSEIYVRESRK